MATINIGCRTAHGVRLPPAPGFADGVVLKGVSSTIPKSDIGIALNLPGACGITAIDAAWWSAWIGANAGAEIIANGAVFQL